MALFAQDPREIDRRASDWMHRGMDWMAQTAPGAQEKAITCYDRAIKLRRKLPLAENPRYRYGLAAGWMNRADALSRMRVETARAESIQSYDEALALLRTLPLAEDALYPRRMAIALINQALVRQKGGTRTEIDEAIRGFRNALTLLESPAAASITDLVILRAAALGNLAEASLAAGDSFAGEAQVHAQNAIASVRDSERDDRKAAEAGGKARHVLCRAIAMQSRDGQSLSPTLLAEATRAVDEGLTLARHWEERGEAGFRALGQDLFRFGCRIHQNGERGFLAKFILECVDPAQGGRSSLLLSGEVYSSAIGALWSAVKELQQDDFQSFTSARFDAVLENLRRLRVAEDRLKDLRRVVTA